MKAIRIKKNNIEKPNNNKKIIFLATSICLFVIVIIGLVLGLGLKTKNNNDEPSFVGRNNLVQIKSTNYLNYYYYSGEPYKEFFQNNIKVQDGSYYFNSAFNTNSINVYMGQLSVYTESTTKSFYLNLNDLEKKTNIKTIIYKYEISYISSDSTYILYLNDFFVNGVEYK